MNALREAEEQKFQMQAKLTELDMLLVEQELKTGEVEFQLEQATEMQEALQAKNTKLISKLKSAETAQEDNYRILPSLQKLIGIP